jgi:alkylhydroperoxidase/carboxymuconolactone decarboxylase family protein YurZ
MKEVVTMPENPLQPIENLDPKLMKLVEESRSLSFGDGALPVKVKLLIALALDATHGAVEGVRSLAQAAIRAGATPEEIAETLRVTQFISGVGSVYTASRGIKDLF